MAAVDGAVTVAGSIGARDARHTEARDTAATVAKRKLHPLTSLRFFAAAMVVVTHSRGLFGIHYSAKWLEIIAPAVSIFFVLSGFILTYVYPSLDGKPGATRRFWLARFARIWPAHVAAFLLFVALIPLAFIRHTYPPMSAVLNLSLLQSWIPSGPYLGGFNNASWSLAVEAAFYLSFPLLIRRVRRSWALLLLGTLLLSAMIAIIANGQIVPLPRDVDHYMLAVEFPPTRFFEFVLGMTTALVWQQCAPRVRWGLIAGTAIELGALAFLLLAFVSGPHLTHRARSAGWISAPVEGWLLHVSLSAAPIALFIFVMALERGALSRLLSLPLLVLLGEISYSVYLFHAVLIAAYTFHTGISLMLPNWLAYLGFWFIVLVAAYVVWALIERPSRRFIVGLWPRRPATATESGGGLLAPSWRYGAAAGALLLIPAAYLVFATRAPSLDHAVRAHAAIEANVDTLNGAPFSQNGAPRVLAAMPRDGSVTIAGWAAPPAGHPALRGAFISVDGHYDVWSTYGLLRPDVAQVFGNDRYEQSGFSGTIPMRVLSPGTHTITIKLVSWNAATYFESPPFTVTTTA